MRIRAVILDIYGTLLDIEPPNCDVQTKWSEFWRSHARGSPRLTPGGFEAECDRVIASQHALAQARGIAYPEVYWPDVVGVVLPELVQLPEADLSELRFFYPPMSHKTHLMEGAAEALAFLWRRGVMLGLASNCQPFSLRDLDSALASAGLSLESFDARLRFLSFEHGFSKPNPHAFQILSARLALLGFRPFETMMVGDSLEADIQPARAMGWKTWHLGSAGDGDWTAFHGWWRRCRSDETR